jgi:thiamine pyrophosphokinase
MSRAIIFANGELGNPGLTRSLILPDDVVIAADGGARHALNIGIIPSLVIGDLDSLSENETGALDEMGVQLLRFPTTKDETDLELAVLHALRAGYAPILILGAFGGRLDQSLANIALLAGPETIKTDIRLDDGVTEAFFVRGAAVIQGRAGDTLSLVPWGMPAEGVTTSGLAYPLDNETLFPYRTRSISNEMLAQSARVHIKSGLLLCIHIRKN